MIFVMIGASFQISSSLGSSSNTLLNATEMVIEREITIFDKKDVLHALENYIAF